MLLLIHTEKKPFDWLLHINLEVLLQCYRISSIGNNWAYLYYLFLHHCNRYPVKVYHVINVWQQIKMTMVVETHFHQQLIRFRLIVRYFCWLVFLFEAIIFFCLYLFKKMVAFYVKSNYFFLLLLLFCSSFNWIISLAIVELLINDGGIGHSNVKD